MKAALVALALLAAPATAQGGQAFTIPGAGIVQQDTLIALLSDYMAEAGCTLDFGDHLATVDAVIGYVVAELGVPEGNRAAALPAVNAAVEATFGTMMADKMVITDPETQTAGLVECER